MQLLWVLSFTAVLFAIGILQTRPGQPSSYERRPEAGDKNAGGAIHPLIFYDDKLFWQGIAYAQKETATAPAGVAGGILPHHLFPSFILADFFKRLQAVQPNRIVLLGPNHPELGTYKAQTSLQGWQTPFGIVEADTGVIQGLVDQKAVAVNEGVVEHEHSVAGIMPFIKFYLPHAKVVPIILRATVTEPEAEHLAATLAKLADTHTLVIAPVDFSHYLTSAAAQGNDNVTWEIMERFDYTRLFQLSNDYVDSPPSIAVQLMVMQILHKAHFNLLFNTNSGLLQGNQFSKTTSYFSIMFSD